MIRVTRRRYDQFCGLARALDVVGERWTLLLVRDLALGPQRYSDLLAGLPGIGTSMLAERLKHLEDEGLVRRTQLAPPAGVAVYELTADGHALVDAMLPLAVWGARRLDAADADGVYRPEWILLTLRAAFRPDAARGVDDTYEFHVDGSVAHARVVDGTLDVRRGPAPGRADLVVRADPATLLEISLGRLTAADAVAAGRAAIDGTPDAAARCQAVFSTAPRPQP